MVLRYGFIVLFCALQLWISSCNGQSKIKTCSKDRILHTLSRVYSLYRRSASFFLLPSLALGTKIMKRDDFDKEDDEYYDILLKGIQNNLLKYFPAASELELERGKRNLQRQDNVEAILSKCCSESGCSTQDFYNWGL